MNEALKVIKERRSCKNYLDKEVSKELLDKILEAGTFAACGRNAQSPVLVCVTDRTLRDKLARMNREILGADKDTFYNAPIVVVVLADSKVPTYVEDGSLALGNMMLAATALGVDNCWIHRARQMFESPEGLELLKEWGLDESYKGVGNLILGYKASDPVARKPRKENYIIYK